MPHGHMAVQRHASNKSSQLWLLFGTKRIFSSALLRIASAKCFLDEFCTCIQSQISVKPATQSQPKLKYKLPAQAKLCNFGDPFLLTDWHPSISHHVVLMHSCI